MVPPIVSLIYFGCSRAKLIQTALSCYYCIVLTLHPAKSIKKIRICKSLTFGCIRKRKRKRKRRGFKGKLVLMGHILVKIRISYKISEDQKYLEGYQISIANFFIRHYRSILLPFDFSKRNFAQILPKSQSKASFILTQCAVEPAFYKVSRLGIKKSAGKVLSIRSYIYLTKSPLICRICATSRMKMYLK